MKEENGDKIVEEENGNIGIKEEIKKENGTEEKNGHSVGDSQGNGDHSKQEEIKEEVLNFISVTVHDCI